MFPEFRRRYPRSALISELVQIDHGKYIVHVRVEGEGRILATGLAAADSVEGAEDRARERAIALLAGDPEVIEPLAETIAMREVPREVPPAIASPTKTVTLPAIPAIERKEPEPPVVPASPKKGTKSSKVVPIAPPEPEKAIDLPEPEKAIELSELEPTIEVPKTEPEKAIELSELEPVIEVPRTEPEKAIELPELEPAIDLPEPEPFSLELEEDNYRLFSDEPVMSEEEPAEIPPAPIPLPPEEIDYSVLKTKIDVEMKRLGWTMEKGRDYLISTYGKKSRLLLTNEELLEFYNHLSSI